MYYILLVFLQFYIMLTNINYRGYELSVLTFISKLFSCKVDVSNIISYSLAYWPKVLFYKFSRAWKYMEVSCIVVNFFYKTLVYEL